jgi:alpha-1,2-mannosyltransferase
VAVDYAFFRKIALVPWNIVAYNIFGGQGRGPEIFGIEPWTFYIRNLLLNFNVWFVLAMLSAPLLLLQAAFRAQSTSIQTLMRSITLVAPFYMWFGIFTIQPHKEERFMYPAYPFLALNAALAFHLILTYIGHSNPKEIMGRVPAKLKLVTVLSVVIVAVNAGMLRILGMVTAYNAPLKVLEPLQQVDVSHAGASVCFGKEWYRFPSSYFLPHDMRAKFIRSEFKGLLPGEFPDAPSPFRRMEGASKIPSGMNDLNIEDPSKYVRTSSSSICSPY